MDAVFQQVVTAGDQLRIEGERALPVHFAEIG
jgi:hypothetical protein